jgi:hypothetical protein
MGRGGGFQRSIRVKRWQYLMPRYDGESGHRETGERAAVLGRWLPKTRMATRELTGP